jgi:hypothetical protein
MKRGSPLLQNRETTRREEQVAPERKQPEHAQICLLGRPPLSRFIECAEDLVMEGARLDRAALIEAWRAARNYYRDLEVREAGIADHGEPRELDPCVVALAAQVQAHPSYRSTFDTLPTHLGMVELDRLIVHQWHVTQSFIDKVKNRIERARDPATLFRICMPLEPPDLLVQVQYLGSRRFVFRCESEDLDFREPEMLRGVHARDGFAVAHAVGLMLGFGSNFLSAVRMGNRVVLNNGYHRAYALRALGITHAPCAIEMATCLDELQLTVNRRVAAKIGSYLQSPRPPLLKDFFDPRICRLLPIRRRVRQIEVEFEVRDSLIPG